MMDEFYLLQFQGPGIVHAGSLSHGLLGHLDTEQQSQLRNKPSIVLQLQHNVLNCVCAKSPQIQLYSESLEIFGNF